MITKYINQEGEYIVIKEMDDYYLRNAFNFFVRRAIEYREKKQLLEKEYAFHAEMIGLFDIGPNIALETLKQDLYRAVIILETSEKMIDALGNEAVSRGRMEKCTNCEGKGFWIGKDGFENPCLICCGNGWTMRGIKHGR